jgi:2-phospho-L-lactate guanylyltransferase (CobY/MobA/RfbA family)
MSFGFGIDSFRKHLDLARDRGIDPQVAKLPGIGLDIDTPSDISELMAEVERSTQGRGGRTVYSTDYSTVRFLEEIGIKQRLEEELADIG